MADATHLRPPQTPTPTTSTSNRPQLRPTTSRLPPPTLFQGPPSRNASRISLTLPPGSPSTITSSPQSNLNSASSPVSNLNSTPVSHHHHHHQHQHSQGQSQPRASNVPPASSFSGGNIANAGRSVAAGARTAPGVSPFLPNPSSATSRHPQGNKPNNITSPTSAGTNNANDESARADALWAEMQNTLAEVELSTMNSSAAHHVFGEAHAKALEDLRVSQLRLRDAWAHSESEEMMGGMSGLDDDEDDGGDGGADGTGTEENLDGSAEGGLGAAKAVIGTMKEGMLGAGATPGTAHPTTNGHAGDTSTTDKTKSNTSSSKQNQSKAQQPRKPAKTLEEETERDILLARKRREANDRYFGQVNRGVLEVVRRLEEVAGAMGKVEREGREIWNETETETEEEEEEVEDGENERQGSDGSRRNVAEDGGTEFQDAGGVDVETATRNIEGGRSRPDEDEGEPGHTSGEEEEDESRRMSEESQGSVVRPR